ncbi:MAG TPA: hypothetical protein VKT82_34195 [Ktedonobacterales bacterium]|nr:hypothetical protein [Ktedonobacterales bacterium]
MPHPYYEELVERSHRIRPLHKLEGLTEEVNWVAFSPDNRLLASARDDDKTIELWEVRTGRRVRTLEGHTSFILCLAFSPNGRLLASGSADGTIRIWHIDDAEPAQIFQNHDDWVNSIAFSPDGHLLASAGGTSSPGTTFFRLWEVETGQELHQLDGHTERIFSIAFSPDGRLLASGAEDHTVRLWEVENFRPSQVMTCTTTIDTVAFSPSGKTLAAGEKGIRLWDLESGTELPTMVNDDEHVKTLAWSPDGTVIASCSSDKNTIRLWDVQQRQVIRELVTNAENDTYWTTRALAFSPDGQWLATYFSDSLKDIQLWDISALDVGPKPVKPDPPPPPPPPPEPLLASQLATLPYCHISAHEGSLARATSWLHGAAAAGWPLPLALAHDLGLLLTQPTHRLTLARPTYLPPQEDTSAYLACLQRLAALPLVRELPTWQPPLSEAVLSVIIARLVEGVPLPDTYRVPSGPAGVTFTRVLASRLAQKTPAERWQQTPAELHPTWHTLLPADALARLEQNMRALDPQELRFLAHYGAPLLGTPDPRDLLDLLALTNLPPTARLALAQTLRLLPYLSETHSLGGAQTYPEGGYEGLASSGSLDSLLPSEGAYDSDIFFHRVLNHEALYYGRERPPESRQALAYLVLQLGWGLGGDGQVLARTLTLALAQAMRQRNYTVLVSLAGTELSEPKPLEKPGEVARLLYAQERSVVNASDVLRGVLGHLHSWRELYQDRQVLWVLSEHFDADNTSEHTSLYQALAAEADHSAWFVRLGLHGMASQKDKPPVAASQFRRWQVFETSLLWDQERRVVK